MVASKLKNAGIPVIYMPSNVENKPIISIMVKTANRMTTKCDQASVYKELARYYDIIYKNKNYRTEAAEILEIVTKLKRSKGNSLLDVACGTGRHIEYLQHNFSCTGIDLSQDMLDVAGSRLKGVDLRQGDMLNLNIDKKI